MHPTIDFRTVTKELPIFSTNISQFKDILDLAKEAIFEEQQKNPNSMDSNVKAYYVSDYSSHLKNKKFEPLISLVLSFCKEVSKKYFNADLNFKCYNCWGMLYNNNDHAIKHNHFPSTFAAVVYIDVEKDSAPIIFEDELTIVPSPGSLIVFPAILKHEVPKSNGKRVVVSMNIENDL